MNTTEPIKVLLVDDHAVVRAGFKNLLESCDDIVVVSEANTGELACKNYVEHEPDVVIMDLTLPGMSGFEATRRIMARNPKAQILVFSMHEDTVFVERALQAGAAGYITKSGAADSLIKAVKQVANGETHLDSEIAQKLAIKKTQGDESSLSKFSAREFEIFRLLADGQNVAEIADRLSLSYKTVANYSTQIKNKLEVKTTAEIARLAIREGLIDP